MRAQFEIVAETPEVLTIRDIGSVGGGHSISITNDAEAVVDSLLQSGRLRPGMRLEYYDSNGDLDEIVFDQNGFVAFHLLPR